jgi:predicted dehydrogenase
MAKIAMLGAGFIGGFYTSSLHGLRSRDKVQVVCDLDGDRARAFAGQYGIPEWTTRYVQGCQQSGG